MKRAGAISILITMALGLSAWAGHQIIVNKVDIAIIREKEKSNKELLIEIRDDVKLLRGRLNGGR